MGGWECYGGRWSLEGRTRPTRPDILDRPVGFHRRGISLCSSFPSTTAADPPSGFKMLRSIASRASRLARSTACKPPGFRRTNEAESTKGFHRTYEALLEDSTKGHASFVPSLLPYRYESRHGPLGLDGLPLAVDWSKAGVVSAARDQGDTPSCWAHAAAESVESLNAIKTGVLTKLSVQQLRECCDTDNSMKGGGNSANAFDYIIENGGLVPDEVYPFDPIMGVRYKHIECDAVTLDGYLYIDDRDEDYLKAFVAECPVCASIAVDDYFHYSHDKILHGKQCDLNDKDTLPWGHTVLVIGYGTIGSVPVWKILNSWSEKWGDQGFRYIRRGVGAFGIGQAFAVPEKKQCKNAVCKVRSQFDMAFGKCWWLTSEDWPRYRVDVGQISD